MLVSLLNSAEHNRQRHPVPEAHPRRPAVSTPATLTPVGYLQFKNGVLFAEHSSEFSKRIGIGQVTKLSVFPRLELSKQDRNKPRSIWSM